VLGAEKKHKGDKSQSEIPTVNQTADTPIIFRPVTTSIQTGTGRVDQGELQLGICMSGLFLIMEALCLCATEDTDLGCGKTSLLAILCTLLGLYTIVEGYCALAGWIWRGPFS